MPKRLPPFGRDVKRILKTPKELRKFSGCTGKRGSVWIATGPGAWDWKYRHPHLLAIVMPDGESPFSFYWGFLNGHEPPLVLPPVSYDEEKCADLAAAMMRDGVLSVLSVRDPKSVRYLKEAA